MSRNETALPSLLSHANLKLNKLSSFCGDYQEEINFWEGIIAEAKNQIEGCEDAIADLHRMDEMERMHQ